MSAEEYILAFESILYGLIISRILVKWNYMIQDDPPKKQYWAFWVLTVTIFLFIIYVFMMNGKYGHYDKISDPKTFLFYAVFPPALFTFIVYQLFPKEFKEVDLKQYLMKYRSRIIVPLMIYILFNLFQFAGSIYDFGSIAGLTVILLSSTVLFFKRFWVLETFIVVFAVALLLGGYL